MYIKAKPNNVIVAELGNKYSCGNFRNCISGTFQYQNKANAIIISNGKVISNLSAHGWLGYPDSVMICRNDGSVTVERHISLPQTSGIKWAISGMGLLDNYNPDAEGYCRISQDGKKYDYSDVLRKTNHTALAYKDGIVYGYYLKNMTGAQVNDYLKKQGMEFAIMLDGGHIASINSDSFKANVNQKQHNIVQFVVENDVQVNVFSASKEGNKSLSQNFKVREFACKDGSEAVFVSMELVELLQKIRNHFNKPVTINSAYRTHSHNKKVGGEKTSQHLYGIAADIVVRDVSPQRVAEYADDILCDSGGIGVYDTFVHVDVRKNKSRWKG